eukprot:Unigene10848_Nuclearia_a/m.33132 Unigene10848_Nuclearia_a/g.33132  ORF Unigene10848_Nuclearia_a/g.33132 Unigene10848_Nuclearia_a/m.33132 type:complete len:138 (+) Unigene10848_Nuclearia_a:1828-2241(+)
MRQHDQDGPERPRPPVSRIDLLHHHRDVRDVPPAVLLPTDAPRLAELLDGSRPWILKPASAARGEDVRIVWTPADVRNEAGLVLQRCVDPPHLVHGVVSPDRAALVSHAATLRAAQVPRAAVRARHGPRPAARARPP